MTELSNDVKYVIDIILTIVLIYRRGNGTFAAVHNWLFSITTWGLLSAFTSFPNICITYLQHLANCSYLVSLIALTVCCTFQESNVRSFNSLYISIMVDMWGELLELVVVCLLMYSRDKLVSDPV